MMKNMKKIEEDAINMEKNDICFCCGESYDTSHLGPINCSDCEKSFKTQVSLERHIFLTHSESDEFPCSICNVKLRTVNLLNLHEEQHKNREGLFQCFKSDLKHHQKYTSCAASSNDTISSDRCNKNVCHLIKLKKKRSRKAEKRFPCDFCDKKFPSLGALSDHRRYHTGEKPYKCTECGQSFSVKGALKRHMMRHSGEKPYSCIECNQSFTAKQSLDLHMRRHTGEKPFPCTECKQSFTVSHALKYHMRLHTGEKPYSCIECNKNFTVKHALNRHMMRHTGEKPYPCTECNQNFTSLQSLNDHMTQHTGEKPYKCIECNKSYSIKSSLSLHKKRHTIEKINRSKSRVRQFTYNQCDEKFKTNKELQHHTRIHSTKSKGKNKIQGPNFNCKALYAMEEGFNSHYGVGVPIAKDNSGLLNDIDNGRTACVICDKEFDSITTLNSHILEIHKDRSEVFYNAKQDPKLALNHSVSLLTKIYRIDDFNENVIENVTTINNVTPVKIEEETTMEAVALPQIISKDEVIERNTESLLLEDIETGIRTPENASMQTKLKTTVPETLFNTEKVFIKEEVNEKSTERLSFENGECFLITIENETTKLEPGTTPLKADRSSLEGDVILQEYIKNEIADATTLNLLRENEEYTANMIESEIITTKMKTPVPEIPSGTIIGEPPLIEGGSAVQNLIKNKTVTENLLFENELSILNVHTEKRVFVCDFCEKKFRHWSILKNHLRSHTGEKPYKCTECNKSFSHKYTLKCHMTRHTGEKLFTCTECNQSFGVRHAFNYHMKRHTGEKPFSCAECNISFAFKHSLNRHMIQHTGEKPFSCKQCNRSFALKHALNRHMKRHTSEKPYKCTKCDKYFTLKDELDCHVRRHTGEKPYACNDCGKRFIRVIELHSHSRTHMRTLACDHCEQKFKTIKQLERHIKIHSSNRKRTTTKEDLKTNYDSEVLIVKYEKQTSMGAGVVLHFSKDEDKRSTDQLLLEDKNSAILTLGNENTKTQAKTTVHGPLFGAIVDDQTSFEGNIAIQNFIKDELNEESTERLVLEKKEFSVIEIENEDTRTKPETFLPETLHNPIIEDRTSCDDNVVVNEYLRNETPETNTENLLLENAEFSIITIENETIKTEPETTGLETQTCTTIDDRSSVEDSSAVQKLIKNKVTKTNTKTLLSINKLSILNGHKCVDTENCFLGCNFCKKKFRHWSTLKNHLRSHIGEKPYKCTENNLNCHMTRHAGKKLFTCTECDKSFSLKGGLKRHMTRHSNERPFICTECNRSFAIKHALKHHMRRHTGEKPYPCTKCNQSFTAKRSLYNHMSRHTGEKPYTCAECNKSFSIKSSLYLHMKRHTGEKPYKCSEYKKSFAVKEALSLHMKRHTGEKPYVCKDCGKRFVRGTELRSHSKTHIRPYACDQCEQKFKTINQLEKHTKIHSPNRKRGYEVQKQELNDLEEGGKYDCAVCNIEFDSVKTLKSHVFAAHEDYSEVCMNAKRALKSEINSSDSSLGKIYGNDITNENPIVKNIATTLIEGSAILQEFIKEEVPETSNNQFLLDY